MHKSHTPHYTIQVRSLSAAYFINASMNRKENLKNLHVFCMAYEYGYAKCMKFQKFR